MSLTLSQEEIVELTGYRRLRNQMRELSAQGLTYHLTANRKLIVRRSQVENTEFHSNEEPNLAFL